MKKNKIIIFVLLLISLCLSGCAKRDTNKEIAEAFLQVVFTVPYEKFTTIEDRLLIDRDVDQSNKMVTEAIESLCGEFVAEDTLADGTSSLYQNVILLHLGAGSSNSEVYTYEVKSIEVTKVDDKHYGYSVEVYNSVADEFSTMTGSIQFNDDNLIDYMTIQ